MVTRKIYWPNVYYIKELIKELYKENVNQSISSFNLSLYRNLLTKNRPFEMDWASLAQNILEPSQCTLFRVQHSPIQIVKRVDKIDPEREEASIPDL